MEAVQAIVPGECLIKLTPLAETLLRAPIPSFLSGRVQRTGIEVLDRVVEQYGGAALQRLHPFLGGLEAVDGAGLLNAALTATYRLRLVDAAARLDDVLSEIGRLTDLVAEVTPNVYREAAIGPPPNDPEAPGQWGLDAIEIGGAWQVTTGHPNVAVAVVDSGVQLDHPDLMGGILQGEDFVNLLPGTPAPPGFQWDGDTAIRDHDPSDDAGHGTHIAGIIAARTNNGIGVAGVAPQCRILPLRALARARHTTGAVRAFGLASDIAAAIRAAGQLRIPVINLSFATPNATFAERDAIQFAFARGCLTVGAMGNDGPNAPPQFPAAYANVVSVGAAEPTGQPAAFSCAGDHIDLLAPGTNIMSTTLPSAFGADHGTSQAAAFVSGVAALLKSARQGLSPAQIASILLGTCLNPTGVPLPNPRMGRGLLNARRALQAL
jgi:subtilisin family serine protease